MFTFDKIYKEALMSLNILSLMGGLVAALSLFISETKEFTKAVHREDSQQDFPFSSLTE